MDHHSLTTLKRRIRPLRVTGTLTLEQASAAGALNRDVARFRAAVTQAERILELAGVLDDRLERELAARAIELSCERKRLVLGLIASRPGRP
jgi:hypothetical protein